MAGEKCAEPDVRAAQNRSLAVEEYMGTDGISPVEADVTTQNGNLTN